MEIPDHELRSLLLDLDELETATLAQIRRLKIGVKVLMDPNPPARKPVVIHSPYVTHRRKARSSPTPPAGANPKSAGT